MTVWDHAFAWAFDNGLSDAFGYANWYVENHPNGSASHALSYPAYAAR